MGLVGVGNGRDRLVSIGRDVGELALVIDVEVFLGLVGGQVEAVAADEEVIFVPDKYLAHYVAAQTGRKFIVWKGFCPTHARILPEAILEQQRLHPAAKVIVHPENRPEVIALADRVLSTGGMSSYARDDEAKEFIVGTEIGILHRMQKENPAKIFYRVSDLAICPNMKRTTLEKVLWSLEEMTFKIEVPPEIMARARTSITRMLEFQG